MYRYTYDAVTRTYSPDVGYPVTVATGGTEVVVLDQDSTGRLWMTFTQDSKVWVTHTTTTDGNWVAPYVLPVPGGDTITPDDIAAIVAFNGQIGVMWGNQNEESYYFAIHVDGDPDTTWVRETAYTGL